MLIGHGYRARSNKNFNRTWIQNNIVMVTFVAYWNTDTHFIEKYGTFL